MLTPLNGRVLVRPDPSKTQSEAGILLPDQKEKANSGTILSGEYEGRRALYSRYGVDEFEGHDVVAVHETALLALLD